MIIEKPFIFRFFRIPRCFQVEPMQKFQKQVDLTWCDMCAFATPWAQFTPQNSKRLSQARPFENTFATTKALEEARAVLGMSKGNTATAAASADEVDLIRRAFKKSVLETHPDKGGSAELFQRVKDAHDVLIAAAT